MASIYCDVGAVNHQIYARRASGGADLSWPLVQMAFFYSTSNTQPIAAVYSARNDLRKDDVFRDRQRNLAALLPGSKFENGTAHSLHEWPSSIYATFVPHFFLMFALDA